MDRAAAFYKALFGDDGRRVHESRHYFECGDVVLALLESEHAQPLPDHVYFATAELDAVHERARTLGALALGEVHGAAAGEIVKRPWGERSFYAADPWGNRLCFVDAATLFTGRR